MRARKSNVKREKKKSRNSVKGSEIKRCGREKEGNIRRKGNRENESRREGGESDKKKINE